MLFSYSPPHQSKLLEKDFWSFFLIGLHGGIALVSHTSSWLLPWLYGYTGLGTFHAFSFPQDTLAWRIVREEASVEWQHWVRPCGIFLGKKPFWSMKRGLVSIPEIFPPIHLCLLRLLCQGNVQGVALFLGGIALGSPCRQRALFPCTKCRDSHIKMHTGTHASRAGRTAKPWQEHSRQF